MRPVWAPIAAKTPLELRDRGPRSPWTVFNPFKKNRKATDMTTPENDPATAAATPQDSTVPPAQDTPAEPAAPSLEQQLADAQAKASEAADAFLRAKAEAENTRRRAEEEISKARKYAVEAFAESLLPVVDSLQAAIAMPEAKVETVLEGVHATLRQLTAALEKNKVVPIAPPPATKFDPHQHQAISMVPADQDANTVVAVLQKGYLINDRVLRPALVTVAAPK